MTKTDRTQSNKYQAEAADPGLRAAKLSGSSGWFDRARSVLPGGTTRVTVSRDPFPIYLASGSGAWVTDVDGNHYLDLHNNFTTLIHGHAFEPVVTAIERQVRLGSCFANPTEHEVAHAEMICTRVPVIERVRYVNTGTEAVMFAVKATRAITGRTKIAKFEGAYHGGYDWVEVSEDSAPDNWGEAEPASTPCARGTPQTVLDDVVVLPFNDFETTSALLERHGADLACVICDPMPSRAGLLTPMPGFLNAIRDITRHHGVLLISDEVLSFRHGYHGAAARFGYEPDLVTLGKIIGGGLPIGAVGGPADIMAVFDNSDGDPPLPQGGTFSANPLSMAAGIAALDALDAAAFAKLEQLGNAIRAGLEAAIAERGLPMSITGAASLFRIHLKPDVPRTYRAAWQTPSERALLKAMARFMLDRGVLLPATASGSLSTAMTDADIDHVLTAFAECLDVVVAPTLVEPVNATVQTPYMEPSP